MIEIVTIIFLSNLFLSETACPSKCICSGPKGKQVMDCSDMDLQEIPDFHSSVDGETFQSILLNDNNIRNIPARAFRSLTVKRIDISNNNVRMSDNAFKSMTGLEELIAENCGFGSIPRAFDELETLKVLNLKGNKIRQPTDSDFEHHEDLEYLDLSDNENLDYAFTGFQMLKKLKTLKMANCGINHLPNHDVVHAFKHLETLVLGNNRIPSIPKDFFKELKQLKELDLVNNPIDFKDNPTAFKELTKLTTLKLGQCTMGEPSELKADFLKSNKKLKTLVIRECEISKVDSNALSQLGGLESLDISGNEKLKDNLEDIFKPIGSKLKSVGLDNMDLNQMPRYLMNVFPNVQNLSLAFNQMKTLPSGSFSGLDSRDVSVKLNDNGVQNVNPAFLQGSPKPIKIDLSNNNIERLDFLTAHTQQDPCYVANVDLDLEDNPINCDPVCGTVLTMQMKLFEVKGVCKQPHGSIGYHLMYNPEDNDPDEKYLEIEKMEECGLTNKTTQRYLCCEKRWEEYDSPITCAAPYIVAPLLTSVVMIIFSSVIWN